MNILKKIISNADYNEKLFIYNRIKSLNPSDVEMKALSIIAILNLMYGSSKEKIPVFVDIVYRENREKRDEIINLATDIHNELVKL